jgi:mannose-6-phosphate isomerase-like protein (cupin superfamily)
MVKCWVKTSLDTIARDPESFLNLYRRGKLQMEVYRPYRSSVERSQTRDEIHVVASGSGEFLCPSERDVLRKGDVFSVAAGVEHSFANCTENFSTWVFFSGPDEEDEEFFGL